MMIIKKFNLQVLKLTHNVKWVMKELAKTEDFSSDDIRFLISVLEEIVDMMEYDNDTLYNVLKDVNKPDYDKVIIE